MTNTRRNSRKRMRHAARGVASLAVTLIMLALSALVILYANRGQIFEQRISGNQVRSTAAFETAEAGIEWATARLNDHTLITPSATSTCQYAAGGLPFKDHYLQPTGNPDDPNNPTAFDYNPPVGARAACTLAEANGALTCHCPQPNSAISLATPTTRSFFVSFHDVPTDPGAVRIRSVGCHNTTGTGGAAVVCNSANSTSDARSVIEVLVKYVPAAGSVANAALTAGGWALVCGSYNITNESTNAGGVLVNSGGQTHVGNGTYESGPLPPGSPNCGGGGGQTLSTIPGTPVGVSMVPNDPALAAAAVSSDSMMFAYFGMTLNQYQQPPTCTISGGSAQDRATNLVAAATRATNPCTRFWVNGDIQFQGGGTLGSASRPLMIASSSNITFTGNYTVYGIIYGDSLVLNYNGTGTADIIGQVVVRGNVYMNGNGSIIFNDSVLQAYTGGSVEFIRVPGSWRDFL